VAEDVKTPDGAGDHAERPARLVNRRRAYDERVARAQHPKGVLRALAGYLQATFSRHSLEDVKEIAGDLVEAIDDERRRHCGPRDDA
jgi:hypothetical protein